MRKITVILGCFTLLMAASLSADLSKGRQAFDDKQIVKVAPAEVITPEAAQGPPAGAPPGTPEYMWEWDMWKIWLAYYKSMVYHYYFGGQSVFLE